MHEQILFYIFYEISDNTDPEKCNTFLVSQVEQSPGDQIPHLVLISFQELIPKKSSPHLLSFTFASVGPKDEQYSSVLLTTNKAKQTLPGA